MGKKSEASLFERFIIMLMGLGVALVGAYPLTKQHGGVFSYLKKKGIDVAPIEGFVDSAAKRARLKYQEIKKDTSSINQRSKREAPSKEIDTISSEDKQELDSLLNDVVK